MPMDKYGVDTSEAEGKTAEEKNPKATCPTCGSEVEQAGRTLLCPKCGSKPFEAP